MERSGGDSRKKRGEKGEKRMKRWRDMNREMEKVQKKGRGKNGETKDGGWGDREDGWM